jgi:outer membrane protein assembly factor BamB
MHRPVVFVSPAGTVIFAARDGACPMRLVLSLACALALGCGPSASREGLPATALPDDEERVSASASDPLPPDLWTRKSGQDWPHFLGPTGDSVSAEKGLIAPWPAAGPKIVWQKEVDVGYAMPSVSRGRLFQFDRFRNRARLRAWKAETAEPLWTFEYPTNYRDQYGYNGGPRCCPVLDGGRVYIYGAEGMLHCVRAGDGKLVWKVDTASEFGVIPNFFGVGSTPVVEGDLLIVQVGGSPKGSEAVSFEDLKGNGSAVVAFDKYTGKVKYKLGDELAGYASPVVATVSKRRTAFVFARGGLMAFDPATGKSYFHYPWRSKLLESVNASNPVVVGNRVLLTECYEVGSALLEVTPGGVREVWTDRDKGPRRKSLMGHWMTPIHVNGYVYGSSGRHTAEAELRCVELATGKVMWREPRLTRVSLLLVDGHFVCLTEDGTLKLLKVNPRRYEEVSSVELKGADGEALLRYPCWAAPILSRGLLFVRGEGRLVCLEAIPEKK